MKSLNQKLTTCGEQQLEQVMRLWNVNFAAISAKKSKSRQTLLLQTVRDPVAARFVWEALSENERLILYRTVGYQARGGQRYDTLLKKTRLSAPDFDAAVESLKDRLLLTEETTKMRGNQIAVYSYSSAGPVEEVPVLFPFMESVDALYTTGQEMFSPKGSRLTKPLENLLKSLYDGQLRKLAQHYDIDTIDYYYRNELLTMLVDELVQSDVILPVVEQLEQVARVLFKWLCEQPGGKANMQEVRKQTGATNTELISLIHTLDTYALAFDTFSDQEHILFVPAQMHENIRKTTLEPQPEAPPGLFPLASSPQAIQSSEPWLVYDMAVIIGAIYQQTIEPTQSGTVPKRLATKILPLLHGKARINRYSGQADETNYMEMLFHVAQDIDIVRLSHPFLEGVKPRYEPGPELEQWSQLDLLEQNRGLLQCWTKCFQWIEMSGANFAYPQSGFYAWNPMAGRSVIAKHLQKCTPGAWYSVTSLLQSIWDEDSFALQKTQYNMRPRDTRKTASAHVKWNRSDGEVYIGMLASTLYEAGIVSLGYSQTDTPAEHVRRNPDYFLVTEMGASVLSSLVDAPPSTTTPALPISASNRSLIVQPNFELLLLQPDMSALYSVLPFAQINQVGMVSRLTLTRQSALRGVESGQRVETMLQFLENYSQKDMPQNVAYTLRDWVKGYKDVSISSVLLLEVQSEDIANELCASAPLQPFAIRKIAPCILTVRNTIDLSKLQRALDKAGIAVRFSGEFVTPQKAYSRYF
ncbi:MAG: helicase-associated domain-containing protein [Chloroflexota bacterium]|nr:helicase-associated domain-containing protein [Chloroflexota bacterium]